MIDVTVEITFNRRPYAGKQSTDTMEFRVVGVRNEDTNLPSVRHEPARRVHP
jgi:hypothetical protein